MQYQLARQSIRGARPTNQDRVGVAKRPGGLLMVVADGLGGHLGGELAADTLVSTMVRLYQKVREPVIVQPSMFLALTLLQAHKAIVAQGHRYQPPIEPRTTAVACLIQRGYAYWAHVGDSRLYHFRDGQLRVRTEDHTSVEQLRRDGLVSEDEMAEHPQKSQLLTSLGGIGAPTITFGDEAPLYPGDSLLLCSDGLWEALKPAQLLAFFNVTRPLDDTVAEMCALAERRRGDICDNVSVVCLRWTGGITTEAPLQPHKPTQLQPDHLHSGTAKTPIANPAPTPPADPAKSSVADPIEDQIQEIEAFLQRSEFK